MGFLISAATRQKITPRSVDEGRIFGRQAHRVTAISIAKKRTAFDDQIILFPGCELDDYNPVGQVAVEDLQTIGAAGEFLYFAQAVPAA